MKVTDEDFTSYVRSMVETSITQGFIPEDLVIDETSMKVLENLVASLKTASGDSDHTFRTLALNCTYAFLRGYAERARAGNQ